MFRSSGSQKSDTKRSQRQTQRQKKCCCIQDYQEEISILQQKLMQTHNKLIDQLDVCQEQELTIIQLTKKIMYLQSNQMIGESKCSLYSSNGQNADISKQQDSFNHFNRNNIKNIDFTLNNSAQSLSNYNSPTFVQTNRNELLKKDLQIMRIKLLQQATQKSQLNQELKQLKVVHCQKITQYKNKIKQLQHDYQSLLQQYQYVKIQVGSTKKINIKDDRKYNTSEVMQLSQKCNQFEKLYKIELKVKKELNQKVNIQKEKIRQLQIELEKYNNLIKSNSTVAEAYKDQREELCGTIRTTRNPGTLWEKESNKSKTTTSQNQLMKRQKAQSISSEISFAKPKNKDENKQNLIQSSAKQNPKKQKCKKTQHSKEEYESTKQLIKKLQEAEMLTRQRRVPVLM